MWVCVARSHSLILDDAHCFYQHERARIIYKYALDHLPKDKCELIYKQFTIHEKKFGSRAAIEDVIVSKRKFAYEEVCVHLDTSYEIINYLLF